MSPFLNSEVLSVFIARPYFCRGLKVKRLAACLLVCIFEGLLCMRLLERVEIKRGGTRL